MLKMMMVMTLMIRVGLTQMDDNDDDTDDHDQLLICGSYIVLLQCL